MKRSNPMLAGIALEHLSIATLETQKSDSLDFHDVAVWQLEAALNAAFDAGTRSARMAIESQRPSPEEAVSVASTTPLFVAKGMPLVPGKMYLRLYHGRTDPGQNMDDWGFVGPTFGPLSCYVHTYCCNFRIHGESDDRELWLDKYDDMIRWDGCFFGDMEVFVAGDNDRA